MACSVWKAFKFVDIKATRVENRNREPNLAEAKKQLTMCIRTWILFYISTQKQQGLMLKETRRPVYKRARYHLECLRHGNTCCESLLAGLGAKDIMYARSHAVVFVIKTKNEYTAMLLLLSFCVKEIAENEREVKQPPRAQI